MAVNADSSFEPVEQVVCPAAKAELSSARMNESETIKVLIVNEDGQYLAGTAAHWNFTEDRSLAKVFDYAKDHVVEQIRLVRRVYGTVWVAIRLDPSETFEFCDRCGGRMSSVEAFFTGREFFCNDCRSRAVPAS